MVRSVLRIIGSTAPGDDDPNMSFEARCPQCLFVSRQLGQPTPCLLHVAEASAGAPAEYDEPYEFGNVHPTVDRPGPFSLREYVRLRLLRGRVQEERAGGLAVAAPLPPAAQGAPAPSR
jgi:hypothetical protein